MKGYTSKAAVEAYLGKTVDVTEAVLTTYMEAMEKAIDSLTGRNFKADSLASARLFDGKGGNYLAIDDCTAITKVEVGLDEYGGTFQEVLATGSDRYFTLPANASAKSLPIYALELSAREFPEGRQNHRVTAKWGFSAAVPSDVAFAATVFTAGIVSYRNSGSVTSEKIGNYSVSYGDSEKSWADFRAAKEMLAAYERVTL